MAIEDEVWQGIARRLTEEVPSIKKAIYTNDMSSILKGNPKGTLQLETADGGKFNLPIDVTEPPSWTCGPE